MAAASDKAPDSAEQLRRRANRRLLGASILLVIAIIAVPMFLEREPPPLPDNVDVRIPPVEGSKFEPKFPDGKKAADKPAEITAITEPTGAQAGSPTIAAAVPATPSPAAPVPTAPATTATPGVPNVAAKAPDRPAEKVVEKPAAKAEAKAPEVPVAAAAPAEKAATKPAAPTADAAAADRKPGQLVVQIIAVRDPATAKATFERARGMKFPVYTEKIDVANGIVTRVRVGPYNSKQQAEAARAKLAQAGFEAKVLTLQ